MTIASISHYKLNVGFNTYGKRFFQLSCSVSAGGAFDTLIPFCASVDLGWIRLSLWLTRRNTANQ
jgi:hypothetical protein